MQAISFYNSNINPEIVRYQARVFKHFGIDLLQFEYNTEHSHGFAIDWWLKERWSWIKWDDLAIFDIDCIPLHAEVLAHAEAMIDEGWLYGAAQKANHIPNSEIYCSPAFCCFTREAYERAGKPTLCEMPGHDVGGYFTNEMVRVGHRAKLLWPTHVENPVWDLTEKVKFGHGTTYGKPSADWLPAGQGDVYHAFESRFNHESASRFIAKCKEILA